MGCVQALLENNIFCIQFKYGQSKQIITGSIMLLLAEEEVDKGIEDSISDLPPKGEGIFLIIDVDPVVEEDDVDSNGMYLSIFLYMLYQIQRYGYVGGSVKGRQIPLF